MLRFARSCGQSAAFTALWCAFCSSAWAQAPVRTPIRDTLYNADGTTIEISGDFGRLDGASFFALRVPLKVDLKAGENWADAKPW